MLLSACGGDGGEETQPAPAASGNQVTQQPDAAANPSLETFPEPDGQTLVEMASKATGGLQIAPGTQVYSPGTNRVAFGLLNDKGEIIYAPAAVYVGRSPNSPAKGPYLAPTDSLITEPAFQSRNAATEADPFASVYAADVDLPGKGSWRVLTLSDVGRDQLGGATTTLNVNGSGRIPEVGDPAPITDTDTVEKAGDITKIDTRVPPDDMHETDLADVIGERPVALLFATPALCQSRVCGPVTDIAEQLKSEYGDQIEFIHQEVYVDNDPAKGIRKPLIDYGLRSEPWLFTIDADGNVAARLEGSFGLNAFEQAIQAAIE